MKMYMDTYVQLQYNRIGGNIMAKKQRSARVRANMKWAANNLKSFKFSFNIDKDADIINKLSSLENKQGYIKDLIRADLAKEEK